MRLDGIHHVTCITGDARQNLDFYTQVLGLRLVKRTVNQDDPGVYHLFYADENGSPGADITFFEFPGAEPGQAGAGMVHTIAWRVGSPAALDFWDARLESAGIDVHVTQERLRFADREGLHHELVAVATDEPPLSARHPDIPEEFALQGFDGVHIYVAAPERSASFLEDVLGFEATDERTVWRVAGPNRSGHYTCEPPPEAAARPGAGTVHHVAFSMELGEQDAWHERVNSSGASPSPVIDRFWFRSIYFREPNGVLFELATKGPGFTTDEPLDSLGEKLTLPPSFEAMREQIESRLTPLPPPRV